MLNRMPPLVPIVDACQDVTDPWRKGSCATKAQFELCHHLPITSEVKAARLSGCEVIAFTVNPEGRPVDIRVKEGSGLGLDEEVAACVAQWRFRAPQKDGANPRSEVWLGAVPDSNESLWHLLRVEFQPKNGATRPVFLRTKYPETLGNERVIGFSLFRVHLVVGKDGIPHDVQVTPGPDTKLDRIATRTVSSWRFRPGVEDGKPVDVPASFALGLGQNPHCSLPK
jgi:TonB family protein